MLRRLQDLHQKHRLDKKWPRRTAGRRTCLRPPRSLGARARLHQAAKQPARNVGLLHFYVFISTSSFLLLHFYFAFPDCHSDQRSLSFRPKGGIWFPLRPWRDDVEGAVGSASRKAPLAAPSRERFCGGVNPARNMCRPRPNRSATTSTNSIDFVVGNRRRFRMLFCPPYPRANARGGGISVGDTSRDSSSFSCYSTLTIPRPPPLFHSL